MTALEMSSLLGPLADPTRRPAYLALSVQMSAMVLPTRAGVRRSQGMTKTKTKKRSSTPASIIRHRTTREAVVA